MLKDSNVKSKTSAPGKIRKKEREKGQHTEPSSAEPFRAQAPAEPSEWWQGKRRLCRTKVPEWSEAVTWHRILRGMLALLRLGWGDQNTNHQSSHGHTAFVWSQN